MKLDKNQYSELAEKLAGEVVGIMQTEKVASEAFSDEKIASIIQSKKEKLAQDDSAMMSEEKAAAVYEYALRKIASCNEVYQDGVYQQQACIETLAEAGLYDENGLNKEAAESSEEAMEFANKVAEIYEDGSQKIAAAEEKYAEAIDELSCAMEVLAEYGYTFE